MNPIAIDGHTRKLGPPAGINKSQCLDLMIRDETSQAFGNEQWSAWEPDPREAALLATGAKIYLSVAGRSFPPVKLAVGHYFSEPPIDFINPGGDLALQMLERDDLPQKGKDLAMSVVEEFGGDDDKSKMIRQLCETVENLAEMVETQRDGVHQLLGSLVKS